MLSYQVAGLWSIVGRAHAASSALGVAAVLLSLLANLAGTSAFAETSAIGDPQNAGQAALTSGLVFHVPPAGPVNAAGNKFLGAFFSEPVTGISTSHIKGLASSTG